MNVELLKRPMSDIPEDIAVFLIQQLYQPDERFAEGFFRYRTDILGMSEDEAWQSTLDELKYHTEKYTKSLKDPYFQCLGYIDAGYFRPIGMYCLRPLDIHDHGKKLLEIIQSNNLSDRYPGKLSMSHSFSFLSQYRGLTMLKSAFAYMSLEAVEKSYDHIFFFMSDHRLKRIYERFDLEFPDGLAFEDSMHLVGSYTLTPNKIQRAKDFYEKQNLGQGGNEPVSETI